MAKGIVFVLSCYAHLFFLAFWGSLITGFFYYGFSGQDQWTCYATQDDQVKVPWDYNTQGDVPEDYHNVNSNFQVVCIWGFFDYLLALIIWYWMLASKMDSCEGLKGLSIAVVALSHLAHFLTMMIMRWRHAGKTCSGDYFEPVNRYSLFHETYPYLHNAGSFLFYAIISQFTTVVASISAMGIFAGTDH